MHIIRPPSATSTLSNLRPRLPIAPIFMPTHASHRDTEIAQIESSHAAAHKPEPWLLPLLAFTITYTTLLAVVRHSGLAVPFESDTLWHVAAGEWMLEHGRIMDQDVFSYTVAGKPWLCPEWLCEILMALVYRIGGWESLFLAAAAAFAAAQALLAARLQKHLSPYFVLTFLMFAIFFGMGHFKARPHVFAWPILLLWISNVIDAVDRDEPPSFWNLPLMILWTNLHGSFVVGLGLLPVFMAEALWPRCRWGAWRDPFVLRWLAFVLGCVAAVLANPNGVRLVWGIGAFLLDGSLARGGEWNPWRFDRLTLFWAWIVLAWGMALTQNIRLPAFRTLAFLLIVSATLRHMRNINLMAFVMPALLAKPLGLHWATRALNSMDRFFLRIGERHRPLALATAATIVVSASALHARMLHLEPSEYETAQAALDSVRQAGVQGPVFNDSYASGALIRQGVKVYIDSRTDLYGSDFVAAYLKLLSLQGPDAVKRFIAGCGARWTLLLPDAPLAAYLDIAPGWRNLHRDRFFVVHVNDNCGQAPTLAGPHSEAEPIHGSSQ